MPPQFNETHLIQVKTNKFVVAEGIGLLQHGNDNFVSSWVAGLDWWHGEMVLRVVPELCYSTTHCYFTKKYNYSYK